MSSYPVSPGREREVVGSAAFLIEIGASSSREGMDAIAYAIICKRAESVISPEAAASLLEAVSAKSQNEVR